MQYKLDKLKSYLKELGSVLVCFSGGVDSALLLAVANEACHAEGVFFRTQAVPQSEIDSAFNVAKFLNIELIVRDVDIFSVEGLEFNPEDRCYICKHYLLSQAIVIAKERGFAHVAEGSQVDDLNKHRPGRRAIQELGVKSPLQHAGLNKADIREISRAMRLPTWDRNSYSCLMTRLPHGERITMEKLTTFPLP